MEPLRSIDAPGVDGQMEDLEKWRPTGNHGGLLACRDAKGAIGGRTETATRTPCAFRRPPKLQRLSHPRDLAKYSPKRSRIVHPADFGSDPGFLGRSEEASSRGSS